MVGWSQIPSLFSPAPCTGCCCEYHRGKKNGRGNPKPKTPFSLRFKVMRNLFAYIPVETRSWREWWAYIIPKLRKNCFQKEPEDGAGNCKLHNMGAMFF